MEWLLWVVVLWGGYYVYGVVVCNRGGGNMGGGNVGGGNMGGSNMGVGVLCVVGVKSGEN